MDVWRLLIAALRRWYVLVPLLAATVAAAMYAGNQVDPEYRTGGSVLLLQPTEIPPEGTTIVNNPYNDLAQAGQVLELMLGSSSSRAALAEAGFDATYVVALMPNSAIMTIDVTADSPSSAIDTAQAVLDLMQDTLHDEQDLLSVPVAQQSRIRVIDAPDAVGEAASSTQRVMLAILGVGAAVSFLIAVLFDDLLLLIRRRRTARRDEEATNVATGEAGRRGMRSQRRRDRRATVSPQNTSDNQPDRSAGNSTDSPDIGSAEEAEQAAVEAVPGESRQFVER